MEDFSEDEPRPAPPSSAPRAAVVPWWVVPLSLSVLAVIGFGLFLPVMGLSAMAFDPCAPGGCPRASQRFGMATTLWAAGFVTVPLAWLFPRSPRMRSVRWVLVVIYLASFVVATGMLVTIPVGE